MYPDWCIYYTGALNKKCDMGHVYQDMARSLTEDEIKWHNKNYRHLSLQTAAIGKRIPCAQDNNVCTCGDFRLPTKAELDENEVKTDAFIKQVLEKLSVVRPAIVLDIEKRNAKHRSIQGKIPCPICETGKVNYSYAGSVNGHIHAQCSTTDCVQWIE